jgi:hypothetical protein
MNMSEAIFLSASVPDPKSGPEYAKSADSVAIQAAVSALVYVVLGRRPLVWGGQPSITPMVWVIAADMEVDYSQWVHLYQSTHFKDEFPDDNERFRNVTFSEDVDGDRDKSLLALRQRMFTENSFSAAVFIGGMGGIVDEFDLFTRLQPDAKVIPIVSTGGATLRVAERMRSLPTDLSSDLDYVGLFHRHLGIPVREGRFARPEDQPAALEERLWRSPTH